MNTTESKRTDWLMEGGDELPMPTHPYEVLRTRKNELLKQRLQRLEAELNKPALTWKQAFNLLKKCVAAGLSILLLSGALAYCSSCSRPVCDYRHVYRGSHKPKPAVHIQRGKLPRGSMLGLFKHSN